MQYRNLGKFIREKRKEKKISLNSFSFEIDVDTAVLSRIEIKGQSVKLNILEKIAEGFGETPAQFLTEFENWSEA